MAKSARASVIKKNKQGLKKRVFGPVETARNSRLSARLLELATQPKPLRAEMAIEEGTTASPKEAAEENAQADEEEEGEDIDMDIDGAKKNDTTAKKTSQTTSSRRQDRLREGKRSGRVQKHRRERNNLVFAKHHMKGKKKGKK